MLGMFFTLFPLTGCSKDEDESWGIVSDALIIGKWEGVSSKGWEKEDGKIVDRWDDDYTFDYDYIEFRFDATGEWGYYEGNVKQSFNWYIDDGHKLVIGEKVTGDGTGAYYKIKTVTKDKLVLVSEDDDPEDGWYQEDTYKRVD